MKNVFGTSLFWIVVFGGIVFYIKLFDPSLGTQVATWFATTPVSIQDLTGSQTALMSGIDTLEATNMQMQVTLDAIASKLGIPPMSGDSIQDITTGSLVSSGIIQDVKITNPQQPTKVKKPTPTSIDMQTTTK